MRLSSILLLALPAMAGPPAVCWQVEIGKAKSLPWGCGEWKPEKDYDTRRVVKDSLELLAPGMPVLVRMETIRRAAIYLDRDTMERSAASRDALLKALMLRVLDAEALGKPSALAWFDAGYSMGLFRHFQQFVGRDGYLWVRKALKIRRTDAEMEYACAILTVMGRWKKETFLHHLGKAAEGAKQNALLERNLDLLRKRYPPVFRDFEKYKKG